MEVRLYRALTGKNLVLGKGSGYGRWSLKRGTWSHMKVRQ